MLITGWKPLSRGPVTDLLAELRQAVGLAIIFAEQCVGLVAVDEAFGGGIEVESAAGTEGNFAEMNQSTAAMGSRERSKARAAAPPVTSSKAC